MLAKVFKDVRFYDTGVLAAGDNRVKVFMKKRGGRTEEKRILSIGSGREKDFGKGDTGFRGHIQCLSDVKAIDTDTLIFKRSETTEIMKGINRAGAGEIIEKWADKDKLQINITFR